MCARHFDAFPVYQAKTNSALLAESCIGDISRTRRLSRRWSRVCAAHARRSRMRSRGSRPWVMTPIHVDLGLTLDTDLRILDPYSPRDFSPAPT